jgi:cyanophycin synthetase
MIKNPPIIKRVVKEMGGTIEKVIPERGYFYINIRGKKIFVSRKFKIANSLITGGEITKFKDLSYMLLKEHGLPTPKTICFYKSTFNKNNPEKKLRTLHFPIILKDAKGSNSKGIFPDLKDVPSALAVLRKELRNYRGLVAQEMVSGKEFRILILKDRVIGALELIPPRIFGNGKDTIDKLIKEKQKKTQKKTPLDASLTTILREQGVTLKSLPEKGKEVYLRKNSSLAEGGETRDVTDLVHDDIRKVCAKTARITEKHLAGIDVMCDDVSKGLSDQNFNILEINGKPDLYIHYNPTHGKTQNVIKEIINFILKLKQ